MHIIYDNCCCVFAVLLWQVQGGGAAGGSSGGAGRDRVQRRAYYNVWCDTPSCRSGGDFIDLTRSTLHPAPDVVPHLQFTEKDAIAPPYVGLVYFRAQTKQVRS